MYVGEKRKGGIKGRDKCGIRTQDSPTEPTMECEQFKTIMVTHMADGQTDGERQ